VAAWLAVDPLHHRPQDPFGYLMDPISTLWPSRAVRKTQQDSESAPVERLLAHLHAAAATAGGQL
jgi:hypothetical protein